MTNERNGLSGIDNLTPFEYALAGVNPTNSQESPSLAVVEQMRALAAEVEDAPITQPRLQELMRGNAGLAKRNERRAAKRRRATADGGFVDITPVELTAQNGPDHQEDGQTPSQVGFAAGLAAAGGASLLDHGRRDGDIPVVDDPSVTADSLNNGEAATDIVFAETEPTSEQPAISITGTDGPDGLVDMPVDLDNDLADASPADIHDDLTDPIQLGADGVVAEATDHLADNASASAALHGLAEEDFDRRFDAIQAAMLDAEPVEAAPSDGLSIEAEAFAEDHRFVEDHDFTEESGLVEEGSAHDAALLGFAAPDQPLLDPSMPDQPLPEPSMLDEAALDQVPVSEDRLFDLADDEARDPSGRFAGEYLFDDALARFDAEQPLVSDEEDLGTPVLVTAGGEGLLLDDEADESRNPLAAAALTGTLPLPVAAPERRFGGAFWALAGTAAAAAVLALGGLLWANSLNDGNTTESASATEDAVADDDATQTSTETVSEGSAGDDAQADDTTTGALTDNTEADEDRPALAVDGEDVGSSTTLDPDTTTPTTATEDPDTETETPATTAAGSEDGTDPNGTDPSATTEPPATDPETTTTVAPETTLPPATEPKPTPAPTTAPVIQPSFIGDRVTLGSFEGPGVSGIRVRLFADGQLLATDSTDEGGFYGFDEFPAGCYEVQFSRIPSGLDLDAEQATQSFCIADGDQNGRFDAVAVVAPPDNCIVEASNTFSDRGVEVHENDFDRADSYTFYNQNGGVVFRTSQAGPPDDLDNSSYGDYEWFAEPNNFNVRNVRTVAAERFGVESAPFTCERQ